MKKILLIFAFLGILFEYNLPVISGASAISSESIVLQKLIHRKEAVKRQAEAATNRIEEIEKEKERAVLDMRTLMEQIEEASSDLMNIQSKINAATAKLLVTEKQLETAIHHADERNVQVQSRVVMIYKEGYVPYLDVLLHSASFSDFLQRADSLLFMIRREKELFEIAKREKRIVEQKIDGMERLLSELSTSYNELTFIKKTLQVKEKNKEVLIASLASEVEELEELTEEQEAFLLEVARTESELLRKQTASGSVKFAYPLVKKARLSSGFGTRTDPVTGKKGASHKGVDFAAPAGTNILASKEGTVLVTDWISGYGNTVIIDHGGGVWTLYAHMRSIDARQGDNVKKGEVIGEVGATGKATGNNLHFEVRVNEKAVDPKPYLGL
ncbi:hypothetical protein FE782_21905 [Paenibacillus antri]|uniref:Uncharacterized protein n=1 Tax=Paenibacillus antri TaxID=2582848 RepID=A0A5R9G6M7_9BACL|nr:M23 family metallopeptidase [Paenibacillus antri]TLS49996.1 hypothetical protein FE782_21905 [Paenibacillus antri]